MSTNVPSTLRALSEREFTQYAAQERWASTEAPFLLRGLVLIACSRKELVVLLPDAARLLELYDSSLSDPDEAEISSPGDWIAHALGDIGESQTLAEQWRFIFAAQHAVPTLAYILEEERDYKEFLFHYLRNDEVSALKLAQWALSLPPRARLGRSEKEKLERILLYANMQLREDGRAGTEDAIPGKMVRTRDFIDRFPGDMRFDLDPRCALVARWAGEYREIASWLVSDTDRAEEAASASMRGASDEASAGRKAPLPEVSAYFKGLSDKAWGQNTALYTRAVDQAKALWSEGDQTLHHAMAKKLMSDSKFSGLSAGTMRRKLAQAARDIGRSDLVFGEAEQQAT